MSPSSLKSSRTSWKAFGVGGNVTWTPIVFENGTKPDSLGCGGPVHYAVLVTGPEDTEP